MEYGGGAEYIVDGKRLVWSDRFFWRGAMISGVPNLALIQGYSTAAWTLGADVTAHLVCRLIVHLDRKHKSSAAPRLPDGGLVVASNEPGIMGLTSNYIVKAKPRLPKTSDISPWRARGNYLADLWAAYFANLDNGLEYA